MAKNILLRLAATAALASLELKKTDVVSGERAVLVPADSIDNGPFGEKEEKKCLCSSLIPCSASYPRVEQEQTNRHEGQRRLCGAIVSGLAPLHRDVWLTLLTEALIEACFQ